MNKHLQLFAFLAVSFPSFAWAQADHFENIRWRDRETDHFVIRAAATRHEPASRYAEKVWDLCVGILPGLKADFGKGEFRTPSGEPGGEKAPFRFTVYLVGAADPFKMMIEQELGRGFFGKCPARTSVPP